MIGNEVRMFLFREEEQRKLLQFAEDDSQKAMAIYGRRRCGKTELITHLLPVFLRDPVSLHLQALLLRQELLLLQEFLPDLKSILL